MLRVAGVLVPRTQRFQIEIPGEYSVVAATRKYEGTLDGTPYAGPRFLGAGIHILAPDAAPQPTAILWSRAAALGFSPFAASQCGEENPAPASLSKAGLGASKRKAPCGPTQGAMLGGSSASITTVRGMCRPAPAARSSKPQV